MVDGKLRFILARAIGEDEAHLPSTTFLVLRHQRHQCIRVRQIAGDVGDGGDIAGDAEWMY